MEIPNTPEQLAEAILYDAEFLLLDPERTIDHFSYSRLIGENYVLDLSDGFESTTAAPSPEQSPSIRILPDCRKTGDHSPVIVINLDNVGLAVIGMGPDEVNLLEDLTTQTDRIEEFNLLKSIADLIKMQSIDDPDDSEQQSLVIEHFYNLIHIGASQRITSKTMRNKTYAVKVLSSVVNNPDAGNLAFANSYPLLRASSMLRGTDERIVLEKSAEQGLETFSEITDWRKSAAILSPESDLYRNAEGRVVKAVNQSEKEAAVADAERLIGARALRLDYLEFIQKGLNSVAT